MGSKLTNMATTKRNLSIMRKLSDVALTYSGIMQARMATYARVGFHNDHAVGVKSLGYETYSSANNRVQQADKSSHFGTFPCRDTYKSDCGAHTGSHSGTCDM